MKQTLLLSVNTLGSQHTDWSDTIAPTKGRIMFLQSSSQEYHCSVMIGRQTGLEKKVLIGKEAVLDSGPFERFRIFRASTPDKRTKLVQEVAEYTDQFPDQAWAIADVLLTSDISYHCLTVIIGIKPPEKSAK